MDRISDRETVLASYAAFADGDIDAAVAPLHPDVDWVEPDEFPGGGPKKGPAEVAEYLRASRARWAELVSEPIVGRRGGDLVVLHGVRGRLVDGTPHQATVADVFTLHDGLVTSMRAHADPLLEAERRLQAAQFAGDVETLDQLLDDRLVFTVEGALHSKRDDLEAHRTGRQVVTSLVEEDVRTLVDGHTGVSWFLGTLTGTIDGTPFTARMRYTRSWVCDPADGWRIVAGHASQAA